MTQTQQNLSTKSLSKKGYFLLSANESKLPDLTAQSQLSNSLKDFIQEQKKKGQQVP